jgi:hypothetical protein
MPKLTDQQKNFCHNYMANGFDMQSAAIAAGYSPKFVASAACRLLKKPQVKAEIDRLAGQIDKNTIITAEQILIELSKIALAPLSERISTSDRLRALELAGKFHAIWTERNIISAEVIQAPVIESEAEMQALEIAGREYVKCLVSARTIPAAITGQVVQRATETPDSIRNSITSGIDDVSDNNANS